MICHMIYDLPITWQHWCTTPGAHSLAGLQSTDHSVLNWKEPAICMDKLGQGSFIILAIGGNINKGEKGKIEKKRKLW